jgi:glutamate-ammonia-ligase adenylyltransferase
MNVVREALLCQPWRPEFAREIWQMRRRLEETASSQNLKRGPGGTVDIEFVVQMLQLQHAADKPEVLVPGTLDAIDALHAAGCLAPDDAEYFTVSYQFLRDIEARLRLMNTIARHDLPADPLELRKLAFLLNYQNVENLLADFHNFTIKNRQRCERIFATAMT